MTIFPAWPNQETRTWSVWSLAAGLLIVALASSLLAVMDPSALILTRHMKDGGSGSGTSTPFLLRHQEPRYAPLRVPDAHLPETDPRRRKKSEGGKKGGQSHEKEVSNNAWGPEAAGALNGTVDGSRGSDASSLEDSAELPPLPSLGPPAPSSFLPPCSYSILQAAPDSVKWTVAATKGGRAGGKEGEADGMTYTPRHALCVLRGFDGLTSGKGERGAKGGGEGGEEAYACLRGKHLVFMGDSLSRYQYLSLIRYLEEGAWEATQEKTLTFKGASRLKETWNDFYRRSSAFFGDREVCDCYREEGKAPHVENRYYVNEEKDLRVSFIGWFGNHPPRGHAIPASAPLTQDALGCAPGACQGPVNWEAPVSSLLQGSFLRATVRPTHLFLNAGLWGPISGAVLSDVVEAAKNLSTSEHVDVFWKTTTSRSEKASTVDDTAARQAFITHGLKVFDSGLFTNSLRSFLPAFKDGTTHYVSSVYTGLNILLLNEIC